MTIRAPVAGRVIERNVRTGEIAGAGAPMLRIAVDDRIELDAEVPERELPRLRVGGAARVVLPSGESVAGEVRRIDPDVDPQEKLGRARIALPAHPELRCGGFARALIAHDARSSAMAPEAALRFSTEGESVLSVDAEGRVRSVRVKTGARSDGRVELIEGPAAGELVIVGGAAFVLEGDAVRPVFDDAEAEDVAAR
jgi:HlyD family secretion protein